MTADVSRYTQSWAISVLGHGAIVALSIAFVSTLKPVPEREPFRWDVALVDAPATSSPARATAPATAPATPQIEPQITPTPAPAPTVTAPPPVARPAPPEPAPQRIEPASSPKTALEPISREPVREPPQAPFQTFGALPPSAPAQSAARTETSPQTPTVQPPTPAPAAPPLTAMAPATSALPPAPHASGSTPARPDISWLSGFLSDRLQHLAYPADARLNGWEGRVVIRLIIHEDGTITDIVVKDSSGHRALDEAAKQAVQALSPLPLPQPLPSPKTVNVPMSYHLK